MGGIIPYWARMMDGYWNVKFLHLFQWKFISICNKSLLELTFGKLYTDVELVIVEGFKFKEVYPCL